MTSDKGLILYVKMIIFNQCTLLLYPSNEIKYKFDYFYIVVHKNYDTQSCIYLFWLNDLIKSSYLAIM
jgi:hypothetical protein